VYEIVEYRDCLQRIEAIFRRFQLRFLLTGGAAFIAYGDPRTTQDVDLVVDVNRLRDCLSEFIPVVKESEFLLNEAAIKQAIELGKVFQLIDCVSTLKIDIYPRELVPGELGRSVAIEILPDLRLPVASLPDLVLSKLIWISKGSHKSRRDVKQLMLRASAEQIQFVRSHAEQLALTALLEEVLNEPDEIDF